MDSRKFILQETAIVAIGELVITAAMIGIFALLGWFDSTVLVGGIVGVVLGVLNFFFMAVSADSAADKAQQQDVKAGQGIIRASFTMRMVVMFVVLAAFAKSGVAHPIAMAVPIFMVRPIIFVAEFFRKSGEKKS